MSSNVLSSILPCPMSADELVTTFASDSKDGNTYLRRIPDQNIILANRMILESLRAHNITVVFAVDAMPWRVIEKYKRNFSTLLPVSSIAPSTSACVWTSILYGVTQAEHGIYGVAVYDEKLDASVSLLADKIYYLDGKEKVIANYEALLSTTPNLFAHAHEMGIHNCLSLGRLAFSSTASLGRNLFAGSQNYVGEDYDALLQNPMKLFQQYKNAVTSFLRAHEGRIFIFMYLDFDAFFHENSYDQSITDIFWNDLFNYCDELKHGFGACSLFVTDHGMARQQQGLGSAYGMDPWYWKYSYARPGGAGRIQFFYPQKQYYNLIFNRLQDQIGDAGFVLNKDEYISQYISPAGRINGASRIGDIIAIGTSPSFRSVMSSSIHEHGSVTPDEMMVGIGVLMD